MKIKLGELYDSAKVIERFLAKELPMSISWKLSKLVDPIFAEIKKVDEFKNKFVTKYGEDDGKGGKLIKPEQANYTEIMKEFFEFMNEETEIKLEEAFSIAKLEKVDISPFDLKILSRIGLIKE